MFNDRSSYLKALATRRSGKPRDLGAPGPSDAELHQMLSIAARTPDHGKLAPWRFVTIAADQRRDFADLLARAYTQANPQAAAHDIDSARAFAFQAPALVVILSAPVPGHKVPVWEQELSAGAVTMNLLHAAHALGFAAGWLTGWAAFSDTVRAAFGPDGTRIAGFVFIGTPQRPLEERPRPDLATLVTAWRGEGLD
ncbi:nitroreductase [Sphingomonas sp.]|jgi:nitroreductase|uniref:nitroreductase family protein n=1 Tax=Sphingomonas sp. TaxID=28214 RepID=UPI002D7EC110|nr:nitroreductase [Sphingomonas sp.]HEU0043196.1 nitroreductase [Sphingomonas sp.]